MRKTKNQATKRLKALLSGGHMRYRAIAEQLNAEGFKTSRGTEWTYPAVQRYAQRHPELANAKPEQPEPTPPTLPLPATAIALDIPFMKQILDSRELTDAKKVAMLKILT
jgi:hypothetical protein